MDAIEPATRLDTPVWYEPLMEPSWVLPSERAGAQRLCLAAEIQPGADEALSLGLPLYLAEALRMTTDAAMSSFTRPFEAGADDELVDSDWLALTKVTPITGGITIGVRVRDAAGTSLFEHEQPDLADATLGAAIAQLPRLVAEGLRDAGVAGVWAPVYVPPSPAHALSSVLGQHLGLVLRRPGTHPVPDMPPEDRVSRRSAVKGALTALGDLATRSSQLFPSLLFFGGVAATRAAGDDAYKELRQMIAAVTMRASNPTDPLNRLSVLMFRLFGEQGTADTREKAALTSGDEGLRNWLMRVRALRWEK